MDFSLLNREQKEAVTTTEGPLLVVAGAGSGKTRVLTQRIAYLIEDKGVFPYRILAVTFTNKAAKEMKERINKLIPSGTEGLWVGTFHSVCARILRGHGDRLGYGSNFVIYDTQDQKTLMTQCIKELNLNEKTFDARGMMGFVGSLKDQMISCEDYKKNNTDSYGEQKERLYRLYQQKLKQNNAMDFNDLIGLTVELFRQHPDVLEMYQEKFRYVLVDEYQDTNRAQYLLIRSLVQKHQNLCVVGDSDQSIYSWRGADIRNILDFEKDFQNAQVIKLEQNYRSHQIILDAANAVIQNNTGRKPKHLWTNKQEGTPIVLYQGVDERDEALYISSRIEKLVLDQNMDYKNFAVLYRTNAQSRALEDSLRQRRIPYKVVGGLKFYDRKEIKDLLAYLRLMENKKDDISFARIINVPKRGIGDGTVDKLREFAEQLEVSLYESLSYLNESNLSPRFAKKLEDFRVEMHGYEEVAKTTDVYSLYQHILEHSGYLEMLKAEDSFESQSRIENLQEFGGVMKEFATEGGEEEKTLSHFLNDMALLSDLDKMDDSAPDTVTLMTLHSAKGLEFPVVFIAGMEENIFPLSKAQYDQEELEEERRLAYVGITRAEEYLYLTFAAQRNLYGKYQANAPSRFIREIPKDLMEGLGMRGVERVEKNEEGANIPYFKGEKPQFHSLPKESSQGQKRITIGGKVRHKKFGNGVVVNVKQVDGDQELTIAFEQNGIKKLMQSFAPLEIM